MARANKKTKVVDNFTEKEEGFCQMIAAGASQWEAYSANYNTNGNNERACRGAIGSVARKPKIKAHIKELVMEQFMPFILEQQERMRILSHIAVTGKVRDQLTAIDQLNRIEGSYKDKIELNNIGQVHVYLPEKRVPLVEVKV